VQLHVDVTLGLSGLLVVGGRRLAGDSLSIAIDMAAIAAARWSTTIK